MKPLRTGLAAGLLAGGVGAANKLIAERRAGISAPTKVVTGANGKTPALGAGIIGAVSSITARRAAKKAEANRPPWVVAPAPGATVVASAPPRPAPAPARKLPTLESLRPPSAKAVGVSMGKYAAKQAGKAIGKAAADRVGKAIEVIEVLEKVVASAAAESASKPDLTPTGPGMATRPLPPTANLVSAPVRPGPAEVPSTVGTAATTDALATAAPTPPAEPPKPRGTLVSVRKFERGPRVVVGPGVKRPAESEPEPAATAAADASSAAEAVVEMAEAVTEDKATPNPAPAKKAPAKSKAAPKKATAKKTPARAKAPAAVPGESPDPDGEPSP